MKIELNEDIQKFISKVSFNIVNSCDVGRFVERFYEKTITRQEEHLIMEKYRKYGVVRATLKTDHKELLNDPYYNNVKLSNIRYKDISIENRVLEARKLLHMSHLQYQDKYLKTYLESGYFDVPVNIPVLTEKGNIWMSSTIAEQRSMQANINKAKGKVLTFGLGIGYFPYMCSLKDEVDSITIIELNEDIIEVFKKYILPQFDTDKKIEIINGNLYDYYKEDYLKQFDYIFVDVWKDNTEGFSHYKALMQTGVRFDNIDFWMEDSILADIKRFMVIYFKSIATKTYTEALHNFSGEDLVDIKRIHKYFRRIDKTVNSSDDLIFYLNDINTIRDILSIK